MTSNDFKKASTYHEQAKLSEQLDAGRYKSAISGTEPTVDYPRLPFSPWTNDPPEPPLGYSVAEVPICGEPHEVERSLAVSECAPLGRFPPDVDDGVAMSAAPPRPTLWMRRLC
jgi:hypothetical protein